MSLVLYTNEWEVMNTKFAEPGPELSSMDTKIWAAGWIRLKRY